MAYRVTFSGENATFYGEYLSVHFVNGEGITESEYLAGRFKDKGLTVQEIEKPVEKMTVAELKAFAETKGIDLGEADKRADILAVIIHAIKPE